jgi:hypothetical protein
MQPAGNWKRPLQAVMAVPTVQGKPRLCLRVGPPKVHAFGRLEWWPPVMEVHRSLRNRFYKNRGDGKRTNNVCTPRRLNRHSGKTEAMKDRQCPRDGPYGAAKYEPACGGQVMAIRRHKEFAWIRKRNKRSRMPFSEC